jgi:predicted small secreted protein
MIKKLVLVFLLIVVSLSLISCQTVQGLGGDIQWTGEKTAEVMEGN